MTNHLQVKIRSEEEFRKAREELAGLGLTEDKLPLVYEALAFYQDFNIVVAEKNISIDNLKDMVFGSTEKMPRLFEDIHEEPGQDSGDCDPENKGKDGNGKRRRKGKGHGRRNLRLHAHVESVRCPHQHLKAGEACPACAKGRLNRHRPQSKTCVTAVNLFLVQIFELESLRCGGCQEITTAAEPAVVKECIGRYHPSAIATLAVLRYAFGMPSWRLADFTALQGIEIPDTTQFGLFEHACRAGAPVLRVLSLLAANSRRSWRDDSPMRINDLKRELKKQKKEAVARGDPPASVRTGISTTVFHAETKEGNHIVLYATGVQHAGEVHDSILQMRTEQEKMIAMADAASLNRDHSAQEKTEEVSCMTHARRNFWRLRNHYPDEVSEVLSLFSHIYEIDSMAKERDLSDDDRLLFHKENSTAAMHVLFVMSRIKRREHEENSTIWKAWQYLENHWGRLTGFLRYPGAPIDNSQAERDLKWAIRHRKNSMFYKTEYGAYIGDVLMSLIITAQNAGVNPVLYLQDLIVHQQLVKKQPADWVPWLWHQRTQATAA